MDDPENGQTLSRLCHFDAMTSMMVHMDPGTIPTAHETDHQFLQDLIVWFREKSNHFTKLCMKPSLPPLPQQNRSLEELQSCAGTIGYTTSLRVTSVLPPSKTNASTTTRARKRPRTGNVLVTFAMVSDGFHQMTLLDPENRFNHELQQVMNDQRQVQIGPIQSCRAGDIPCLNSVGSPTACADDEVLLVCGVQTKVSSVDKYDVASFTPNSASRPTSSMTLSQNAGSLGNLSESAMDKLPRRVLARIIQIFVNGGIVDATITHDDASKILFPDSSEAEGFPQAKLLLGLEQYDQGHRTLGGQMIVFAQKANIVNMLCGGVEWDKFRRNDRLRQSAIEFLLSLLSDSILLLWHLVEDSWKDNHEVMNVKLFVPHLHEGYEGSDT